MLGLNAEVLGPDERRKAIKDAVLASSTFVNAVESLHAELEAAKAALPPRPRFMKPLPPKPLSVWDPERKRGKFRAGYPRLFRRRLR